MYQIGRKEAFIREFVCPECGSKMYAPKHKRDKVSHVKDMWCWKCKEVRKFVMTDIINER